MYVDGIQRAVQSIGPTLLQSNTRKLNIGRDVGKDRYLDGAIDDAYVFDYALGADEILKLMKIADGGLQRPGDGTNHTEPFRWRQ